MDVETDSRSVFPLPPADLWAALVRVDEYRTWWPWLQEFDGGAVAPGEEWSCVVRPPLPYRVRFRLRFDEVEHHRFAAVTIWGDIEGHASMTVRPLPDGTELHLTSRLAPARPALRVASTIAGPVTRYGHDWVIETGLRQFARQLTPR